MVSIVTINYNCFSATQRLIESLCSVVLPQFEMILVDNKSSEEEILKIKNYNFPSWVTLVFANENLGFSGGNNLGFKYAKYDYIMVLNCDTVIKTDFLTPLINKLSSDIKIGIVCPKIFYLDRPNVIQFGGYAPLGRYMIDIKSMYNNCEDNCCLTQDVVTPFAHGAAMMFHRNTLKTVGVMPESYFLYFEELDWSLSFKNKGYKIVCVNNSAVYHEGSHSTAKIPTLKLYYNIRNRLIFANRNLKGYEKMANIMFQLGVSCPKYVIRNIKEPKSVKMVFKGITDFLKSKTGKY